MVTSESWHIRQDIDATNVKKHPMSAQPLKVLLVEDQYLIARQLEAIVESAGHIVIGIATSQQEACSLATEHAPDLAIVDVSLSDGPTGLETAYFINQNCGAKVVFATANVRRLPADFCGAIGVVEKPFTRLGMVSVVNYVASQIHAGFRQMTKPESLLLSPKYVELWQ